MRKILYYFVFIMLFLLLINGCANNDKNKPVFQNNTKWICKELDFYFEVSERYYDTVGSKTYGQINLNGEITEIVVAFDYGIGVIFVPVNTIELENGATESSLTPFDKGVFGKCKFSANKLVVTVTSDKYGILGDLIKTLTFIKSDIPDNDEGE